MYSSVLTLSFNFLPGPDLVQESVGDTSATGIDVIEGNKVSLHGGDTGLGTRYRLLEDFTGIL